MKKIITSIICAVAVLAIWFFGTGLLKNTSAFIQDYAVSADGSRMTLTVGVASSMGYLRKVEIHQQQGGKLYLDCYNAFGGLNGNIGATNEYTVPLLPETDSIALYKGNNCYTVVLSKDEAGNWERV